MQPRSPPGQYLPAEDGGLLGENIDRADPARIGRWRVGSAVRAVGSDPIDPGWTNFLVYSMMKSSSSVAPVSDAAKARVALTLRRELLERLHEPGSASSLAGSSTRR